MAPTFPSQERFEIGKQLGRGSFGKVYSCYDRSKLCPEPLACKIIKKRKTLTYKFNLKDLENEVNIMKYLKKCYPEGHDNIVGFEYAFEDEDTVGIVMEQCSHGNMEDRLVAKGGTIPEAQVLTIMQSLMFALDACHSVGIMHRDVKLANLLISNDKRHVKLCDFGLAKFYVEGQTFGDIGGSEYYMAPEVWDHQPGPESDIWSAGVSLYKMLCGRYPFNFGYDAEYEDIKLELRKKLEWSDEIWASVSSAAKQVLCRMLEVDPKKRMTVEQFFDHPWVTGKSLQTSKTCSLRELTQAVHVILKNSTQNYIDSENY